MHRKHYAITILLTLLIFSGSSSHAAPSHDITIWVKPFFQNGGYVEYGQNGYGTYGCAENDTPCDAWALSAVPQRTMKNLGCAVTSMTMLYYSYGMQWIPYRPDGINPWRPSVPDFSKELDPKQFNLWAAKRDSYGILLGYNISSTSTNLSFLKTTKNFFYRDPQGIGLMQLLQLNDDCSPFVIGVQQANGTTTTYSHHSICSVADMSSSYASTWLDKDLDAFKPPIVQIDWTDNRNPANPSHHPMHFIVIGGYDNTVQQDNTALKYRAYNPSIQESVKGGIPTALSKQYDGVNKVLNEMKKLYRFDHKSFTSLHSDWQLVNYGMLFWQVQSPVEIQVIDAEGRITGYDPETGQMLTENPDALYYEQEPVSAAYGADDPNGHRYKELAIMKPSAGNYILKIFGTGDGPYTITMEGRQRDYTLNLNTSITGTAAPGLREIYRVGYSPTGQASLSQSNQAPSANAGTNQTGEQSYEIALDGSGSNDPDGDPLKYTWSFVSKPDGSMASLSSASAVDPSFTPDLPGTYTLQLVVNDYFTDSTPSTVTITATPMQSRISVTPIFSTPISAGSGFISFYVNNIGRIDVSSGLIDMTLKDPDGNIIATGNQGFSVGVGQAATLSIPVTIPPLKFGNYTLIYTQTDETRTGNPTTVAIANSVSTMFSFDKTTYRVRETANLSLTLTNTGKFDLNDISVIVSASAAGYSDTQSMNIGKEQVRILTYAIPIPAVILPGQQSVSAILTLLSGSSLVRNSSFAIPSSSLAIAYSGAENITAGDVITLTVENSGQADTDFVSGKINIVDSDGVEIYSGNASGSVLAGEKKMLIEMLIPPQAAQSSATLFAQILDTKTGKRSYLTKPFDITGLTANLQTSTGKDTYLKTEAITALSTVESDRFGIDNGSLKMTVSSMKPGGSGQFNHFLPRVAGWARVPNPTGIATASDGSFYVVAEGNYQIHKFDSTGSFVAMWGGQGSGDGQLSYPRGIAVGTDGTVYVADTSNHRVQKFDSNGNFIAKWGGYGSGDGQFYYPWGIALAPDGSVYIADVYNNRIQKFDSNGNFIAKWGSYGRDDAHFYYPYNIAIGRDGTVFVADTFNNRVQKFDSNGNFIAKWGSQGRGDGQFNLPCGIDLGTDGTVYVADTSNNRIQAFDSNGNFRTKWGTPGKADGQLISPYDVATAPDGSVLVADFSNNRIQKFNSAGQFIMKWVNYCNIDPNWDGVPDQQCAGQFYQPIGTAIGPDGSLYVTESMNHRVQKFDSNGNFVTKWGSRGNANGQFYEPDEIAVGADGSVYVADTFNHRVQKFDSNGNFIKKWGDYGSGDGQFYSPLGIAVSPDGFVYVADTHNNRIQKFDSNGNFVMKWGSFDGRWAFSPFSIAVGPDGSIYATDTWNEAIHKFDSEGNLITVWWSGLGGGPDLSYPVGVAVGLNGSVYIVDVNNKSILKFDSAGNFIRKWAGTGLFNSPQSIAIDPEGSVYVTDAGNHVIQKMIPPSEGVKPFLETTVPVSQAADTSEQYIKNIGAVSVTGKLYLTGELKNNLGQTIATAEYPFYIIEGNTVLLFNTDKKVYKPGETVLVTGEVRNLAPIEAANLTLQIRKQKPDGTAETIYTEPLSVPAAGSHSFTASTVADAEGSLTLNGRVTQNNSALAEITDQYEVASPEVAAAITAPDVVGNEPFNMDVEVKNTGKMAAVVGLQSSVDNQIQNLAIPAGETKLVQYSSQIVNTTAYTFTFTGDLNQTITKTVGYGLGAGIQFGVQSSEFGVFPEGKVAVPVTIANTGQLDETVAVTYQLSSEFGVRSSNLKSYFIPKNTSINDTLYLDLTAGSYQLAASSTQPAASTQTAFSVVRENVVAMTATAGTQGSNGLIPVTVNLTNSGYNDISGSITLAVINNDGRAVWRGETYVANLKSQTSGNYTINVDSTGIISGAYATNIVLYSSSGLQLVSNQTQVRVLGPIFEITSVPANPAFTAGKQAVLNFAVKNTGTAAGTATFSANAMDILNQSSAISLAAGEEKPLVFNFTVPEDAEGKDYLADYAVTSVMSQPASGKAAFRVNEVKVNVAAALDKEAYRNGETAILSLNISKLSQTEDGTYIAIIRYGSHHDMQPLTLSSQPVTLTFNVPLTSITGERLFYGIHFESGNAIYRNSVALSEALADLAAGFTGQISDDGTLIPEVRRDNTVEIAVTVTNYGKTSSTSTSLTLHDGESLIETKPVRALNPNESSGTSTVWNVLGKAGSRLVMAVIDPQDAVAEYSEENNTSIINMRVPDLTIFTDTDKETYKIRQKVYVTSTLTNLTSATTYTNLLLLTSAKDSSGQEVYNKSLSLGSLPALNGTTSNQVWSTAGLANDGIYTIVQRLFAGSDLMSQSTKTVTLEKAPDFTLTTDIANRKVKQGEQAIYTASVAPFNGWNHEVAFNMEGLPAGASVTFNPDRLVPPGQTQATVATSSTTTAGTYTLYLAAEGTDEGEIVSRNAPLTLDVSAFELETAPTATIRQLETAAFPIALASHNGYEGSVSLSFTGLPFGTRASFDSPTVLSPGLANLSIRSSKYAKPGSYTITVTGNDGLVIHSLNLSLVLQPNPDIAAGIVTSAGPGPQNEALVKIFSANGQPMKEFTAFSSKYGASAITADIDGDGYDEIIVAQGPDPKNTATLRAFKKDGAQITEYTAFDSKYGLTLASADLDGDWTDELIVGTGPDPKSPGVISVLKYTSEGFTQVMTRTLNSQNSYGVNVAAGDIDGDGMPEIITAPGPGPNNPATVTIWKYSTAGLSTISTFTAFEGTYGVNIAAGDTDGDGKTEIVAGAGPDPRSSSMIRVYKTGGSLLREFTAYDSSHNYGVNVSTGDVDGDGTDEIITGLGPGPQNESLVKAFKTDGTEVRNLRAYPETIKYGVKVSGGNVGSR